MKTKFTEQLNLNKALSEALVDRKNRIIRNVCVLTSESKNRRTYSSESLDDVVHLIDANGRCFYDHSREDNGSRRSTRELIGKLSNPRREDTNVFADLKVLEDEAPRIFSMAEDMPDIIGMSIDGEAVIKPSGSEEQNDLVERVMILNSTDLVAYPATTKSLFEEEDNDPDGSTNEDEEVPTMEHILRLLKALGADTDGLSEDNVAQTVDTFIASMNEGTAEAKRKELDDRIATLETELEKANKAKDEIEAELDGYKTKEALEQARKQARADAKEYGIPDRLVSDVFINLVANTEDEEARKALLEERKAIADSVSEELDLGASREERQIEEEEETTDELSDDEAVRRLRGATRS